MSQQVDAKPQVTIVVEWENIQLAEEARCFKMLGILAKQIDELQRLSMERGAPQAFEVLVLYDNEKCDGDAVRQAVGPFFPESKSHCRLRLHPAPGLTYYEQKNLGAREASADIVVYVDSDVIPEEGWLQALLSPFEDAGVNVVAGNSFLSTSGAYSKAFALFWFFPLKSQRVVFEPRRSFFANNVAFRRDVVLKHPLAAIPGATRGACHAMARRLRECGIVIHHHSGAQVSHPAPNGLRHFVTRGLAQGRDHVFLRRAAGKGAFFRTFPKVCLLPLGAMWKIVRNHRRVGLSLFEMPVALAVGVTYSLLVVAGHALTRLAPTYARNHWQL